MVYLHLSASDHFGFPGIWPMPRVAAAFLPHGETASQHRTQVVCGGLNQESPNNYVRSIVNVHLVALSN